MPAAQREASAHDIGTTRGGRNRKSRFDYDKARNVVERLFCRIKNWRRLATRFDRNVKNFIAANAIAAIVIWWLQ